MGHALDPNRTKPNRRGCTTSGTVCKGHLNEHLGWRHAKSWDEVQEYLDAGALVADRDGDEIKSSDGNGRVFLVGGGGYDYTVDSILIEDVEIIPEATPEEEDEALQSILASFKNTRLDQS